MSLDYGFCFWKLHYLLILGLCVCMHCYTWAGFIPPVWCLRNNTCFIFKWQFGFVKLNVVKWTFDKVLGNWRCLWKRGDGEGRWGEHHGGDGGMNIGKIENFQNIRWVEWKINHSPPPQVSSKITYLSHYFADLFSSSLSLPAGCQGRSLTCRIQRGPRMLPMFKP